MNTETLKSYKLTQNEWHVLAAIAAGHYAATNWLKESLTLDLDVLVLAGLVERGEDRPVLTSEGREAAGAIDMIFDWDEFAFAESPESPSDGEDTVFLNGEPIKRSEALEMVAERPKPLSVGSLVRHVPTGGVGLITQHTMYDANWGGFYVDFVKPVDNVIDGRVTNQLTRIFDRGDKFERV
jgi:hypothetical protein